MARVFLHDVQADTAVPADDKSSGIANAVGKMGKKFEKRPPNKRRENGKFSAIQNTGDFVERRPLTNWEAYAQALLFSNELAYVN
jgi:hypothetical protein